MKESIEEDEERPVFPFDFTSEKTYKWYSHGFLALVRPDKSYRGSDPNQVIRVKIIKVLKRPKRKGFEFNQGETVPVFAEELS